MSEILISLAVALISTLCVWVTKNLVPYLKSKHSLNTQEDIVSWIKIAVAAAEQIFKNGKGEDKFAYVERLLGTVFVNLEYAEMKALIESEVYKLKNSDISNK